MKKLAMVIALVLSIAVVTTCFGYEEYEPQTVEASYLNDNECFLASIAVKADIDNAEYMMFYYIISRDGVRPSPEFIIGAYDYNDMTYLDSGRVLADTEALDMSSVDSLISSMMKTIPTDGRFQVLNVIVF